MCDRITYCDVCECAECPRYGDDCDGDKRSDDLINRVDAIEAVEAVRDLLSVEAHCAITERITALPSAEPSLKAIKRQIGEHWYLDPPSAEAVQGWIPCSERLPDEGEKVLVCLTDWQSGEHEIDVSYRRDFNLWHGHGRYNNACVAWIPLPTPYKGGDE